jgi:hypothetical protein
MELLEMRPRKEAGCGVIVTRISLGFGSTAIDWADAFDPNAAWAGLR